MSQFIVSARKYRPANFEEVVGQPAITNTLENAIRTNHLAQAYLFCGPRGVGKTTCARIFAKVINSEADTSNSENQDYAFNIFELDAASNNSVEDIRSLTEQVRVPPQVGKYKVYIIDEVHMLSQAAFNAFLKTLEEPPPHAIFILATTEKHKIIPTILSRCQIFDFQRIGVEDIVSHLENIARQEQIESEQEALHIIAQKADGALRDALSIFDQMVSFSEGKVTYASVLSNLHVLDYDYYFKLTDHILDGQIPGSLLLFDEILSNGFDGHHFIAGLASHFRNLLVCKDPGTLKLLEVANSVKQKYAEQANRCSGHFLVEALDMTSSCDVQYKSSNNARLLVEIMLMRLCSPAEKKNDGPAFKIKTPSTTTSESTDSISTPPKPAPPTPAVNTPTVAEEQPAPATFEEPAIAEKRREVLAASQPNQIPPKAPAPTPQPINPGKTPLRTGTSVSISAALGNSAATVEEEVVIDHKEEERKKMEAGPSEVFSQETLQVAWNKYAEHIKNNGKESFYTTMIAKPPVMKENFELEIELRHKVEENELHNERAGLLNHLREQLQNSRIQLSYVVNEQVVDSKPYTNRDKFDRMVQINPNLQKLRQQFDLDIDF